MGKKSCKSRRTVKRLFRKISSFFTALYWLMGFVLTAFLLWDRLFG